MNVHTLGYIAAFYQTYGSISLSGLSVTNMEGLLNEYTVDTLGFNWDIVYQKHLHQGFSAPLFQFRDSTNKIKSITLSDSGFSRLHANTASMSNSIIIGAIFN